MKIILFIIITITLSQSLYGKAIEEDEPVKGSLPTNCGVNKQKNPMRIVGGTKADPYSWPWMCALIINLIDKGEKHEFSLCGASIINERWLLTAAHCFYDKLGRPLTINSKTLLIFCGASDIDEDISNFLNNQTTDGKIFAFDKYKIHPEYNIKKELNDVALIKLSNNIVFNKRMSPVCLEMDPKYDAVGDLGTVTGWGNTESGTTSNVLIQASFPIVANKPKKGAKCKERFEDIDDCNLCTGLEKKGIDACEGDSGGPLVIYKKKEKKWYQVGIVSYGDDCEKPKKNTFGVYAKVYCVLIFDFIKGNVEKG